MLFSIISVDKPDSLSKRLAARPDHLQRLQQLYEQGRLVLAGPHPNIDAEGFSGSLIIADFTDYTEARKWAEQDPYVIADVYANSTIKPFKQVFPPLN